MTASISQPLATAARRDEPTAPSVADADNPQAVKTGSPADSNSKKSKPPRDHRLDFWRGLCLVDMLLAHFIHQGMNLGHLADAWIGEYTRFAAGGFVFVAGLSIGRIFLPKASDPAKRWATYRALWKRSLVILLVHYLAEIGFLVMWPLIGNLSFRHIETPIWHILVFKSGYDLLPFYVIMVALAPLMLELLRRRLGWLLGLISVTLFCCAHGFGWWYEVKLPIHHDFFPILWQVIFVAGMIAGEWMPKYDKLTAKTKTILAGAMWGSQIVLFLAYYGKDFGIDWKAQWLFAKVPLTGGEALRYLTLILAIIFTTDVLWKHITDGGIARAAERLGRNSLPVYVFHVWVVQVAVQCSSVVQPIFLRVGLACLGLVSLWLFAWFLESVPPAKSRPAPENAVRTRRKETIYSLRAFLGFKVGGLSVLCVATFASVFLANGLHGHLTHRYFKPNQVIRSPDADLFKPRDEVPLPIYEADPKDPSPDDDVEEDPQPTDPTLSESELPK